MGSKKIAHFSPGRVILAALAGTIGIGTALLALPIAQTQPVSLLDTLFTATSAVCVTGLFTIPLTHFSAFGKVILLLLIQVGGLGIITLTLFAMSLIVNLGFTTQLMAGKLLDIESWKDIKKTLAYIILLTMVIELLGAFFLFPVIQHHLPGHDAAFLSFFHSVSSFCGAGISLFGSDESSIALFQGSYIMLGITSVLMLCGGLGFIIWIELIRHFGSLQNKKRSKLSLLTRVVLSATAALLIVGTLVIWVLERNNAFANMGFIESWINAFFQAVSVRSAGLFSVPINQLQLSTLLFMMVLMFIGSAPSSTGSGIKVTTLAVLLATIKAAITGRNDVNMKGRRIPKDQVFKTIAIFSLSLLWILFLIFLLFITEGSMLPFDIALESVSSLSNIGVSNNLTHTLSLLGKLLIMVSMIIGRIGSFTLLLALRKYPHKDAQQTTGITYPEERIMLS